jgi:AcrR family transcriptional regulator
MAPSTEQAKRPGGRTARNRAAIHRAVRELLVDRGLTEVTVAAVAERSGVHPTSIYRRWGTLSELLLDVILEATAEAVPTLDTGPLRGDLARYALDSLRSLDTPIGIAAAQILLQLPATEDGRRSRREYWRRRAAALQPIFDRAIERGEQAFDIEDTIEAVLAPLYFRCFVTGRDLEEQLVSSLVERALPA